MAPRGIEKNKNRGNLPAPRPELRISFSIRPGGGFGAYASKVERGRTRKVCEYWL